MPEQPQQPNHNAETLHSVAGIRAGYDATIAALTNTDPANKIPAIMDKAIAAAKAGDLEGFEMYFDELLGVGDELMDPALPFPVYTDVFQNDELLTLDLVGVSVGSDRSFNAVTGITISERERVRDDLKYHPHDFEMNPYNAYRPQSGLAGLLASCIETDTPPDAWIERASLDPMHKWTLYLEYYKLISRDGTPEQQINALAIVDGLAADLLRENSFNPGFVQAAAKEMLEVTKNPELQVALLNLGHKSIKEHPREDPTQDMHWAADITSAYISGKQGRQLDEESDPGLRPIADTIESLIARLRAAGIANAGERTVDSFVNLMAALMYTRKSGTESLIEGVNAITRTAGSASGPDSDAILCISRDRTLKKYAVLAAATDDFADARTLLEAIFDDHIREQALNACYQSVKEPGDLAQLDDNDLFIDPEMNPQLDRRATEAKVTNNPTKIAETMVAITEQASHNMKYRDCLEELYTRLAGIDPGLAERTGQQVLATFRGLYDGQGYIFIKWLTEALIRSGNVEELAHAYAQITQGKMDIVNKLHYLRQINQIIDETYPDLPQRQDIGAPAANTVADAGQDAITRAIMRILRTLE